MYIYAAYIKLLPSCALIFKRNYWNLKRNASSSKGNKIASHKKIASKP